jgi:prevent-host-death family protein
MKTLSSFEAKTRFGELLRLVRAGEEIIITWRDEPVARVIPEGRDTLAKRAALGARVRASRERCRRGGRTRTVRGRELVNEGRRF